MGILSHIPSQWKGIYAFCYFVRDNVKYDIIASTMLDDEHSVRFKNAKTKQEFIIPEYIFFYKVNPTDLKNSI